MYIITMPTQAQRDANKKYRLNNYVRCKSINAKSNRKQYSSDKRSQRYALRRNYLDVENAVTHIRTLFLKCG
jgi:hypothetical protein